MAYRTIPSLIPIFLVILEITVEAVAARSFHERSSIDDNKKQRQWLQQLADFWSVLGTNSQSVQPESSNLQLCSENLYSKIEEADRVYDFLTRLNPKFDDVFSKILGQRPTPSLMEVCSEIRLEEDRSTVMNISVVTSAAFATKSSGSDSDKKPLPVCEHCKKQWHMKDQCWKLHGKPPNYKRRQS
ncbi:uncharacterized protein LOC120088988 [Benincasa hispida]|uniref:uncharacterized protein LOC120088988 n=1 Tax=Benincasa hispida TaxID=102211 RepID=UPI0019002BF0|nr:uncharacterized protein LOC120088988 [Benincasa hispida]